MTLGRYLRRLLRDDSAVGALAAGRIYSEVLPQNGAVPAVVFNEVAGDSDASLDGPTGIRSRRVQVDSWARTRAESSELSLAVRGALDGHSGGAAGLEVQSAFHLFERWDLDAQASLYRTSQDYEIWTGGIEA